jgi:phosphomannomutase
MKSDLFKLQNGSDIRGIVLPGIPGENVNLTPEISTGIAKAFLLFLALKLNKSPDEITIGVGHDSRLSADALKNAFIQGVSTQGGNIVDAGLATTPAMFMSTQFSETKCDAAVMITASHLPFNRNGFKFFTASSGLESKDISEVLKMAGETIWPEVHSSGNIRKVDLLTLYSDFINKKIRAATGELKPLKGKKILVDAGNGAGGFFASHVLEKLGADTSGSLFLEPDGNFPNHIPNPEDKEALSSIIDAVQAEKADLGIIFDTDVDRAAIIDEKGNPLNRNRLIALISAIILEEHPASYVVTDSVTSAGLNKFIEKRGGKHFRYRRGYRNVINKSMELNREGKDSWLAIETSGHGALRENYFLDDGAFLTAKILISFARLAKEGKPITSLNRELEEPVEESEFRLNLLSEDFQSDGQMLIENLQGFVSRQAGWQVEPENHEGIRVSCDKDHGDGWFLLRLSLHDPVMPLNVESGTPGGTEMIVAKLYEFLKNFKFIKTDSIS